MEPPLPADDLHGGGGGGGGGFKRSRALWDATSENHILIHLLGLLGNDEENDNINADDNAIAGTISTLIQQQQQENNMNSNIPWERLGRICFKIQRRLNNNNNNNIEATASSEQQQQQHQPPGALFEANNIFDTVLPYLNILDLHKFKCVSKRFHKLCTTVINNKCQKTKPFETRDELRDAVWTFYEIKYDPFEYQGDETRRRNDAEMIGTKYGWIMNNWLTSKITDFSEIFMGAFLFNEEIGSWDTSKATDMSYMFMYAHSFNKPIGDWNTSNVKRMTAMFSDAKSFNQNISNWNTLNVTDMHDMFNEATSFNQQDINVWVTQNVEDGKFDGMFYGATSFDARQLDWFTEDMFIDFRLQVSSISEHDSDSEDDDDDESSL